MLVADYLKRLQQSYSSFFDVYKNKSINGEVFNIYAYSNIKCEKYIGTKKFKVWGYESYEHCLVKLYKELVCEKIIDSLVKCLKGSIDILINPHSEHMSSIVTCVVVSCKGSTKAAINKVEKTKITRMFAFGFKGWCDVRLVLVDLKYDRVFSNKKGREVVDFYKPSNILKR